MMTQCPGESSGLDHTPSLAAVSLGGQRVGQPGFRGRKGRVWPEGLGPNRSLLRKGLKFLEENPRPGARQKAR